MGSSPTRGSSFFLRKVTALGVLCCFALLFVHLACFFLPSFSSLIKTCTYVYIYNTIYSSSFCRCQASRLSRDVLKTAQHSLSPSSSRTSLRISRSATSTLPRTTLSLQRLHLQHTPRVVWRSVRGKRTHLAMLPFLLLLITLSGIMRL